MPKRDAGESRSSIRSPHAHLLCSSLQSSGDRVPWYCDGRGDIVSLRWCWVSGIWAQGNPAGNRVLTMEWNVQNLAGVGRSRGVCDRVRKLVRSAQSVPVHEKASHHHHPMLRSIAPRAKPLEPKWLRCRAAWLITAYAQRCTAAHNQRAYVSYVRTDAQPQALPAPEPAGGIGESVPVSTAP